MWKALIRRVLTFFVLQCWPDIIAFFCSFTIRILFDHLPNSLVMGLASLNKRVSVVVIRNFVLLSLLNISALRVVGAENLCRAWLLSDIARNKNWSWSRNNFVLLSLLICVFRDVEAEESCRAWLQKSDMANKKNWRGYSYLHVGVCSNGETLMLFFSIVLAWVTHQETKCCNHAEPICRKRQNLYSIGWGLSVLAVCFLVHLHFNQTLFNSFNYHQCFVFCFQLAWYKSPLLDSQLPLMCNQVMGATWKHAFPCVPFVFCVVAEIDEY